MLSIFIAYISIIISGRVNEAIIKSVGSLIVTGFDKYIIFVSEEVMILK